MSLFPIFCLLISSLIIINHFLKWDIITARFKKLFFIGFLNFAVAKIFTIFIHFFYKVNYDKLPLFFYLWISEILIFTVFLVITYLLIVRRGLLRFDSYREYPFVFSYISGFLVLSGVAMVFGNQLKVDSYILFIYPVVCIIILLLYSVIFIEAGTRRSYKSYLLYSLLLPLSLILALIPWLYYINYIFASFGLTLVTLIVSISVFSLLKKDYIRN